MKVCFNCALDPAGMVRSNSSVVICLSLSTLIFGDEETIAPLAVISVLWISISFVLREMELVSSTTLRLVTDHQQHYTILGIRS